MTTPKPPESPTVKLTRTQRAVLHAMDVEGKLSRGAVRNHGIATRTLRSLVDHGLARSNSDESFWWLTERGHTEAQR